MMAATTAVAHSNFNSHTHTGDNNNNNNNNNMTVKARKRREEAVRRLVSEIQQQAPPLSGATTSTHNNARTATTTSPTSVLFAQTTTNGGGDDDDPDTERTPPPATHDNAMTTMSRSRRTIIMNDPSMKIAHTVAQALAHGLDRDLHAALVQSSHVQAEAIADVCHNGAADAFLASVLHGTALSKPCANVLAEGLQASHPRLVHETVQPLRNAALHYEHALYSVAKAQTIQALVQSGQAVAVQLERARKQANLGRPRSALQAVQQARHILAAVPSSANANHYLNSSEAAPLTTPTSSSSAAVVPAAIVPAATSSTTISPQLFPLLLPKSIRCLEDTPFGQRALHHSLPRIENDVLMQARRTLNRWLFQLRKSGGGGGKSGGGGEQAALGRVVLRQVSTSMSTGISGHAGLGGALPHSYLWRARSADQQLVRLLSMSTASKSAKSPPGPVARALRLGYWFDRDASKEADRLILLLQQQQAPSPSNNSSHSNHYNSSSHYDASTGMSSYSQQHRRYSSSSSSSSSRGGGMERRAEAVATALGWYRCWEDTAALWVDPAELDLGNAGTTSSASSFRGLGGSRHGNMGSSSHAAAAAGSGGLSGSRHGLQRSRHGSQGGANRRTLGFRASTNSRSQAYQEITSTLGNSAAIKTSGQQSKWAELLIPSILLMQAETTANSSPASRQSSSSTARKDKTTNASEVSDEVKLMTLSESVHPVRRAELAFALLGRSDEFMQYYESNRFGEGTMASSASASSTAMPSSPSTLSEGGGGNATKDDMISNNSKDKQQRSALSSLTGDDVSAGTDRVFFAQTLSHLGACVVGFCAIEAALEMGRFTQSSSNSNSSIYRDDEDLLLNEHHTPIMTTLPSALKGSGATAAAVTSVASAASGTATTTITTTTTAASGQISASRFRESSERYERALLSELGSMIRNRAARANLAELVRASALMTAFRASLKVVHPSSSTRKYDSDLLAMEHDILITARKVAQNEQLMTTRVIVADDNKIPMLVSESPSLYLRSSLSSSTTGRSSQSSQTGVPDPEEIGLPFGLHTLKQIPQKADLEFQEQSRTSFNRAAPDESFTFSPCVVDVIRSLHSRSIAVAAFALTQEELGQTFPPTKMKGSASAIYVLECVEDLVNVASGALKDSENVIAEGLVDKAVQVMANISALQHCLPRFFATLMRGLCHIGLVKAEDLEDTMDSCESILKGVNRSCDSQVGSTYSLVYEISRNKIDSHINYALENFNWVAKSTRDMPNAYCEGLIGYLKSVFASLGPMDEGSRAGLHFSCLGHVSERLVKLLAGKPGDSASMDDGGIPPMTRIDAFGIKNLALDVEEFERFADGVGIPQLRDCFNELKVLTTVMLDKDLPGLLLPENAAARRRKYPILSMDKVGNILEKYVGTGLGDKLMGSGARNYDFLFIDKKEVQQLLKIVRSQVV